MNVNQHATSHSLSLSPKDLGKKKNCFFSPKDFVKNKKKQRDKRA
jgi:hypothetical protein